MTPALPGDATQAKQGFADLAAQNARIAATNRRTLFLSLLIAIAVFIVLVLGYDVYRASAPARYASALKSAATASESCDAALARRRLWLGPVAVSHALCVSHERPIDVAALAKPPPDFSFLLLGDWGRDGMCCQRDVAVEMAVVANRSQSAFIVSLGDNFYDRGIASSTDRQVATSWRDVYIAPFPALRRDWLVVLGNHDYSGNPVAQTVLNATERHWRMPHRYFFDTAAAGDVFLAFLDTTCMYYKPDTLQSRYRHRDGTSPEYRARQLAALDAALARSTARWKLVFGHHPLYSSGLNSLTELDNLRVMRETLAPIFKKHRVAAYFAGHEHSLEHHYSDGLHMFVSGGGSKVGSILRHWNEQVFTLDRQGFTQVALQKGADEMVVTFFDLSGVIVHNVTVQRPV